MPVPAHRAVAQGSGMKLRSLLFVPADRPERFAKAAASGADAIILDLEDSVAASAKPAARAAALDYLMSPADGVLRMVRVNPLGSDFIADDIQVAARAYAVMLPKAEGATSVAALQAMLGDNAPPILPIATETPAAIFQLGTYQNARGLIGLTWGAEDLPAAVGAQSAREEDGAYTPPYQMARSLALFAAHAAGVPAIETVFPDIRNGDGLAAYAARGARDGFTGMMAIHPSQVAIINAAFSPTAEQIEQARRILDAFAASPGAGAVQLDGRMIDAPHLKQACNLLARAGRASGDRS